MKVVCSYCGTHFENLPGPEGQTDRNCSRCRANPRLCAQFAHLKSTLIEITGGVGPLAETARIALEVIQDRRAAQPMEGDWPEQYSAEVHILDALERKHAESRGRKRA